MPEPGEVAIVERRQLAGIGRPLERILSDRLEHPVAVVEVLHELLSTSRASRSKTSIG